MKTFTEDEYLHEYLGTPEVQSEFCDEIANTEWGYMDEQGAAALMQKDAQAQQQLLQMRDPRQYLRKYWGHDDFRGKQFEIIQSILSGQDTIGLMPTGGGKSISFQVPALMMEGICVVITPLIALMRDQVDHLRSRGIRAVAIHSGLSGEEIRRELDNCRYGDYKFLYLSPERIHTRLFQEKLKVMPVSFIAVDEAHCISQWGFDFRPSYLRIKEIRKLLPKVAILALTATATAIVLKDIAEQLELRNPALFRMSFERKNIAYIVQQSEDKFADLVQLLHTTTESAIVYHRSRGGTRETAIALQQLGIPALYYHAGLSTTDKNERQAAWQNNKVRVMVATNAFGMGIDKADVRLVVHLDLPDSIEAYFQEAGRAGRDGQAAKAILLYGQKDLRTLAKRVAQTFPEKELVRKVYEDLACYFTIGIGMGEGLQREFDMDKFCIAFKYYPLTVYNALAILERAGYLHHHDEHETRSRIMVIVKRSELYHYDNPREDKEKILTALLRSYTGLFGDYVWIDEAFLAKQCQCTENDIYEELKALTRARIVHYIPRKNKATITYLVHRERSENLRLGAAVYETRKAQYEKRINGMLNYCTDYTNCRSLQLLRYFDDHEGKDCGHCDVCMATQNPCHSDLRTRILMVLQDGKAHLASNFRFTHLEHEALQNAFEELLTERKICFDGTHYRLA